MTTKEQLTKKDHIREYRKAYYLKNRELILTKYKVIQICSICGHKYSKYNYGKHSETKKHKDEVDSIKKLVDERNKINIKLNGRDKLINFHEKIIVDVNQ